MQGFTKRMPQNLAHSALDSNAHKTSIRLACYVNIAVHHPGVPLPQWLIGRRHPAEAAPHEDQQLFLASPGTPYEPYLEIAHYKSQSQRYWDVIKAPRGRATVKGQQGLYNTPEVRAAYEAVANEVNDTRLANFVRKVFPSLYATIGAKKINDRLLSPWPIQSVRAAVNEAAIFARQCNDAQLFEDSLIRQALTPIHYVGANFTSGDPQNLKFWNLNLTTSVANAKDSRRNGALLRPGSLRRDNSMNDAQQLKEERFRHHRGRNFAG